MKRTILEFDWSRLGCVMDGTQCLFCEVHAYWHPERNIGLCLQRMHLKRKLDRDIVLAKFASKSPKLKLARSTCTDTHYSRHA